MAIKEQVQIKPAMRLLVGAVSGVTLVIGAGLTALPAQSAALLGLADQPILMRLIGVGDLALGTALLRGKNLRRWLLVRSLANVGLAVLYGWTFTRAKLRRGRSLGGLVMMLGLSVFDYNLARKFPKQ